MTGLSAVRTISHDGEGLARRRGGGGQPTDGWQDKSREVRPGRSVEEGQTLQRRQTMCPPTPRGARSEISHNINFRHTSRRKLP
jgi:hypothetical protein